MQCQLASGLVGVTWVGGSAQCNYTCNTGYFRDDAFGCRPCSRPVCISGMYPSVCGSTSNSVCVKCAEPLGAVDGMYSWTTTGAACDFTCSGGFFKQNKTFCAVCTDVGLYGGCAQGSYLSPCTSTKDAYCIPCSGRGSESVGVQWTNGCDFDCVSGFFRHGLQCMVCTADTACPLGFYASRCNYSHDTACVECNAPGLDGTFEWTGSDCLFIPLSVF